MSKLVSVIEAARKEWLQDCSLAYDLGLFETSQDEWIAQAILREFGDPARKPAKMVVPSERIATLLNDLHDYAEAIDREYGLPIYYEADKAEMISIVGHALNLEIK